MSTTKVTIAEIKALSRKAFPEASIGWNIDNSTSSGVWYSSVETKTASVRGYGGGSRMAARRALRDLLLRLIGGGGDA